MRYDNKSTRRMALAVSGAAIAAGLALAPSTALAAGTSPMYRLYNHYNGDHMYTLNASERDSLVSLGWDDEGTAWQVPDEGTAVYRLYNPYSGEHLFTESRAEYDQLGSIGWQQEGEGFRSASKDDDGAQPIYRLYNQYLTAGTHLYTTSSNEYNNLAAIGWSGEDIAFYGAASDSSAATTTDTSDTTSDSKLTLTGDLKTITLGDLLTQVKSDLGISDDSALGKAITQAIAAVNQYSTLNNQSVQVLELSNGVNLGTQIEGQDHVNHSNDVKYVILPQGLVNRNQATTNDVQLTLDRDKLTWANTNNLGITLPQEQLESLLENLPIVVYTGGPISLSDITIG